MTKIEWTDEVWNPVTGCTKVSQGCKNCYAERQMRRFWPEREFSDIRIHTDRILKPLRWKKPRRVFVNSMSDLFHEYVPVWLIEEVFRVMRKSPQHIYQVLTKRPDRMREIVTRMYRSLSLQAPEHVWLGVSVEDQETADERIPVLLQTPASVRFVSCEPLLGPVDLMPFFDLQCESCGQYDGSHADHTHPCGPVSRIGGGRLHWVIVGGESGPRARPMCPEWARSIRDQCAAANVPFFFKQWGEWAPADDVLRPGESSVGYRAQGNMVRVGRKRAGRLLDGVEHNHFPVSADVPDPPNREPEFLFLGAFRGSQRRNGGEN